MSVTVRRKTTASDVTRFGVTETNSFRVGIAHLSGYVKGCHLSLELGVWLHSVREGSLYRRCVP